METQQKIITDELILDVLEELDSSMSKQYNLSLDYEYYRGPWLLSVNSFLARLAYISGVLTQDSEHHVRKILKRKGLTKDPWLHEDERGNIYECTAPHYLTKLLNNLVSSKYYKPHYFKESERFNVTLQDFKQHLIENGVRDTDEFLKAYVVSNIGILNFKNRDKLISTTRLLADEHYWSDFVTQVLLTFQYICEDSLSYLIKEDNIITYNGAHGELPYMGSIFKKAYNESILENHRTYGEGVPDIAVYKFKEQIFNEFDMISEDFKYLHKDGELKYHSKESIIDACVDLMESLEGIRATEDNSIYGVNNLPSLLRNASPITYCAYIALFTGSMPKYIGDVNYYILSDANVQRLLYGDEVTKRPVFIYGDVKPLLSLMFKVNSDESVRKCFRETFTSGIKGNVLQYEEFIGMYTFLIEAENKFPGLKKQRHDLLELFVYFCTIKNSREETGELIDISDKKDYCNKCISNFLENNIESRSSIEVMDSTAKAMVYLEIVNCLNRSGLYTFITSILCIVNFENGYPFMEKDQLKYLTISEDSDYICTSQSLSQKQLDGLHPIKKSIRGITYSSLQDLWDEILNGIKEQGINNKKAFDIFFKE